MPATPAEIQARLEKHSVDAPNILGNFQAYNNALEDFTGFIENRRTAALAFLSTEEPLNIFAVNTVRNAFANTNNIKTFCIDFAEYYKNINAQINNFREKVADFIEQNSIATGYEKYRQQTFKGDYKLPDQAKQTLNDSLKDLTTNLVLYQKELVITRQLDCSEFVTPITVSAVTKKNNEPESKQATAASDFETATRPIGGESGFENDQESNQTINEEVAKDTRFGTDKPTAVTVKTPCEISSCRDGWGVKFEAQNKSYYLRLPPARSSMGSNAKDIPNALPGLAFKFKHNIKKIKVPGTFPVYQHLGVDSLNINMVGMFTGADGFVQPQLPANAAGSNQASTNVYSQMNGSYKSYQDFYNLAIVNRQNLTATINMSHTDQSNQEGIFSDAAGNPKFTGMIKSMEVYHARPERTYYAMQFEITKMAQELTAKCSLNDIEYKIDSKILDQIKQANTENEEVKRRNTTSLITEADKFKIHQLSEGKGFLLKITNCNVEAVKPDRRSRLPAKKICDEVWLHSECKIVKEKDGVKKEEFVKKKELEAAILNGTCVAVPVSGNRLKELRKYISGTISIQEIAVFALSGYGCWASVAALLVSTLTVVGTLFTGLVAIISCVAAVFEAAAAFAREKTPIEAALEIGMYVFFLGVFKLLGKFFAPGKIGARASVAAVADDTKSAVSKTAAKALKYLKDTWKLLRDYFAKNPPPKGVVPTPTSTPAGAVVNNVSQAVSKIKVNVTSPLGKQTSSALKNGFDKLTKVDNLADIGIKTSNNQILNINIKDTLLEITDDFVVVQKFNEATKKFSIVKIKTTDISTISQKNGGKFFKIFQNKTPTPTPTPTPTAAVPVAKIPFGKSLTNAISSKSAKEVTVTLKDGSTQVFSEFIQSSGNYKHSFGKISSGSFQINYRSPVANDIFISPETFRYININNIVIKYADDTVETLSNI